MAEFKMGIFTLVLLLIGLCGQIPGAEKDAVSAYDLDWPKTAMENRPGCSWWWMGSAVDKEQITWNLERLREAGMGRR